MPVDGFGTVEVDLDQPGATTKPVKMVSVAYVLGLAQNLLSTRKAVEQWGKLFVYNKTKVVLGLPGEELFLTSVSGARASDPTLTLFVLVSGG